MASAHRHRAGGLQASFGRPGWMLLLMLLAVCTSLLQASDSAVSRGTNKVARPQASAPSVPTQPSPLNCGSLYGVGPEGVSPRGQDPRPAEACLLRAFLHCQPARLDYTRIEVDSGLIHHFRLERQPGRCQLSDATALFIAPSPPRPAASYGCRAVTVERERYRVLGCGAEGDILLPTPPPARPTPFTSSAARVCLAPLSPFIAEGARGRPEPGHKLDRTLRRTGPASRA
ncbi:hypothetical protein [Thermogemmatispora sp.]|uniref:hypothetical protein n=1 Tax=Thermogemmatispora sp. TaxID=1968838 RepID=UPI0035E3FC3E